jgi:hypothetical protein
MRFYIIYPRGDRSKISVSEVEEYEKDDYALASRHTFIDEKDAIEYAKILAKDNNKIYVGDDEPDYLD